MYDKVPDILLYRDIRLKFAYIFMITYTYIKSFI